ncbi:hypothetical protein NM208_g16312 [Fusarium decemcellulare]|uniref:Uncharacterized protein n=1 Tax=Fusarium decemcellulare TaxID=57161 RepID=A0ACC1RD75_9HYPO|nr:hypothetical protein NM208_g16312 [Fusarium decemcellulare]
MAGIHRRTDNDRRKSSDFYDRRDDRRDDRDRPFDYRDRTSDRFHRSPREPLSRRSSYERDDSVRSRDRDLERDRDKDLRPNQGWCRCMEQEQNKEFTNPLLAGGTPVQRIQVREAKNIAQILSVSVHYRTQLEIVEKKLENIKADENRLSIKPAEFGSAGDMLRNKIQETEKKRAKFQQEVDAADAMLQTALNSLLKKQQPTSSDGKSGAQSSQKQSIGSISGLEARLMELQKSTVSLFNTQLNVELSKVQESAKSQADSNSSEVEELRKSLEEEKRKNQLLEQRLDKLERKFEGTRSGTDIRFSAMEQKSSTMAQKLSTAEQKLSTDAQALSELRQLAEGHAKQLTDMKSIASLPSKPSASDKQFRASIAEQDRKMSTLRNQLDPLLAEIRQLKETSKSQASQYFTSKDGSEVVAEVVRLKQLLKLHTTAMEKHDQKQGSLAADISSLHSSTKLQQQKQESLEGIVKSLESAVKREQQKGGSLAAEVSSLRTTMSKWPTEELRQFIAEAPSAKDLKQLLSDLPPARDLAQLLTELPPASAI